MKTKRPPSEARQGEPEVKLPNIISAACTRNQENLPKFFTIDDWRSASQQLLPLVKGWEATFVRQLLSQKHISCIQEEKLRAIMARHLTERRICRYCGKTAQNIDNFSYYCPTCGNCLSLESKKGGEG